MGLKFSQIQQKAIAYLRENGGILERWPGGFWTVPGTPSSRKSFAYVEGPGMTPDGPQGQAVPDWYIGTNTVRALEKKGVLERMNVYPEEWRDSRRLKEEWR